MKLWLRGDETCTSGSHTQNRQYTSPKEHWLLCVQCNSTTRLITNRVQVREPSLGGLAAAVPRPTAVRIRVGVSSYQGKLSDWRRTSLSFSLCCVTLPPYATLGHSSGRHTLTNPGDPQDSSSPFPAPLLLCGRVRDWGYRKRDFKISPPQTPVPCPMNFDQGFSFHTTFFTFCGGVPC